MIEGAIFDVDGTLLDSMWMWRTFGSSVLKKYGKEPEENLDEKIKYFSLAQTAEYFSNKYLDYTPKQCEEICMKETYDFYAKKVKLRQGAFELCKRLFDKGVKMYIATATYKPLIEVALKREGVLDFFQGIVTCTDIGKGKDSPDIFNYALDKLGCDISKTWVFEDAFHAVNTAKKAGFKVLCIRDEFEKENESELRKISDIYVEDFYRPEIEILFDCEDNI